MKHKVLFKLFSLISVALFLSIVGAKAEELGSYYDAIDCATVTEIPVMECEALIDLYYSTDGANWNNNTGWNVTSTPCSWYGVTCGGGHVSKLNLSNNQLTGSIPTELCDLNNLECLDLSNNQFSGPIPACLDHLPPCSNPAGLIFFSSCTYSAEDICIYIAENGQATPVVKRTGGDGAVSVDIIIDDITNILSWSDGDTSGKAFAIEIVDEMLIAHLYNPTGGAELGLPNIAVIINIPPTNRKQVTEIKKNERN
ncbi:MAG: leucine-rich repeat domain-containing protein [Pseudomonadota bacterium]